MRANNIAVKMTNWEILLGNALEKNGESWRDVEFNTMSFSDMKKMFYPGYGDHE